MSYMILDTHHILAEYAVSQQMYLYKAKAGDTHTKNW